MDLLFLLAFVAAIAAQWRKAQEHRQRVHFLAGYLRSYQIEKLMETLFHTLCARSGSFSPRARK